jgi:hypothetical protein
MSDMTVANTILQQLGSGRFLAMTGASNLTGSENSLSFKLPRIAAKKITHVRIELSPSDDYTMTFLRCSLRPLRHDEIEKVEGVYAEDMQRIFTETTGLKTSL